MSSQLLMIEDDTRLAEMVGEYLGQSGLHVTHRADGKSGLAQLQGPRRAPARPGHPGPDAARHGRPGGVPPHLLAARPRSPGAGADAHRQGRPHGTASSAWNWAPTTDLPKPFEPRELLARIRAILRRRSDGGTRRCQRPRCASARWRSTATRAPSPWAGRSADLTSYQFDLLVTLAERAGRVLTRDQIMEAVRGRELEAF